MLSNVEQSALSMNGIMYLEIVVIGPTRLIVYHPFDSNKIEYSPVMVAFALQITGAISSVSTSNVLPFCTVRGMCNPDEIECICRVRCNVQLSYEV